uniref:Apple domain-containing protein n=1 Tax=Branchiostoma floridae TaxID=7739 RepID=C3ZGB4_BRAFL|eukprot:XP_002592424.1 hypothetical protein BRAFLDRAFT_118422 [Branchiostoma floridae]
MFWWSLAALVVVGSSFGRTQTTTENPQDSFQYLEQMEFPTITAVDPDGDASSLLTVKACAQKCLDLDNSCRAFGTNHGTFRSCYFYNELEAPANRSIKDLYIKIGPTTEQPALLTQTTGGATQQKQTSRPAPPGGSSGDNTGAIAGGVIAVLLLVLLIVLAVPLWRRYKKRKRGEAFYDRMQQNVRMDGIPVDAGTAVRFSAAGNRSNGKTEQEILLEQGPADGGTVEYATVNKNRKKAEPDRQELKSAEGAAEGADLEDDDPSGYDTLQRTRDPYLYPMTIADFDQSEDPEPDQGQRSPEVTYAQLDLEDKGGNRPVIGGESEEDKTVYSQLRHSRMKYDNLRR